MGSSLDGLSVPQNPNAEHLYQIIGSSSEIVNMTGIPSPCTLSRVNISRWTMKKDTPGFSGTADCVFLDILASGAHRNGFSQGDPVFQLREQLMSSC